MNKKQRHQRNKNQRMLASWNKGSKPMEIRIGLWKYIGQEIEVDAIFIRKGRRNLRCEVDGEVVVRSLETYLIRNVTVSGRLVCQHVWIDSSPSLRKAMLSGGEFLTLKATVSMYVKDGCHNCNLIGARNVQVTGRKQCQKQNQSLSEI